MSEISVRIIHPGRGLCQTVLYNRPWWETPHCPTCTCTRSSPEVPHGRYVECGYCHQAGILPDPGYEQEIIDKYAGLGPGNVRGGPDPE